MDSKDRLVAILNSVASLPPTSESSSANTFPPPMSSSTQITRSPPASTKAVTLQDLFNSMIPASLGLKETVIPPQQDHQSKLLGMLKTIGSPPMGSATSSRAVSGVEMPNVPDGIKQRQNLLNMFKSPSPQLADAHPSGPTIDSEPSTNPDPRSGISTSSAQIPSLIKDQEASVEPPPNPPKKSMFDFVSPFDAFDKPKSKSKPTQASKSASPAPARTLDKEEKYTTLPVEKANGADHSQSTSAATQQLPPPLLQSAVTAAAEDTAEAARVSSSSTSTSVPSKPDLPEQVSGAAKDVVGRGPSRISSPHTVIDLSQPNAGTLVNSPGAVQVVPVTIRKSDNTGFTPGRSVGVTAGWMAYALHKGRVRLIDSTFGAKLVLQLPSTAAKGAPIDIAVTRNSVAVVGVDRSVTVFEGPSGWGTDDPACEMVMHVGSGDIETGEGAESKDENEDGLGAVTQVEWIRRSGDELLAIGGSSGLIVIAPDAFRGKSNISMREVIGGSTRVLLTEGEVVSFGLNHSHQAIGLVSSQSYITLYSVATLLRAYHRQLPNAETAAAPSSFQFCDSNILVGRANDTHFDLVQITGEIAVLSSIDFTFPSPSSPLDHFAHAQYDSVRNVLWIAPFARGSLFAFNYALKSRTPVKREEGKDTLPTTIAFDNVAEYPLEQVLSFVLGDSTVDEDAEIFFATPNGFSQAQIAKAACDSLRKPAAGPAQKADKTEVPMHLAKQEMPVTPMAKQASKQSDRQQSKQPSPVIVKTELPSSSDREPLTSNGADATSRKTSEISLPPTKTSDTVVVISSDELSKVLKKTEDKLSNHFKQLLLNQVSQIGSRIDASRAPDLASELSAKVETQIKATLTQLIQQEVKRSVLPTVSATLQTEVRTMTGNIVPAAIFDALQIMPKEIEKGLAPIIQRSVESVVQSSVERMIPIMLEQTLLPALMSANTSIANQLAAEMKSDMIQLRKDLEPPTSTEPVLENILTSMTELQRQVASLSDQLARATSQAPPPVPMQQPSALPLPTASQLEDIFLTALGMQSTGATLQLVNDHMPLYDYILPPSPNMKSPLSQAVLLTLLHRLALALNELVPADPTFTKIASWELRIASHLDPFDNATAAYLPRVVSVVQDVLGKVLHDLGTKFSNDPMTIEHMRVIKDIFAAMGQMVH